MKLLNLVLIAFACLAVHAEPEMEMMDPDDMYPPGVAIKIKYEADKDLFKLSDEEEPNATQLYAEPEDLAFAIRSLTHIIDAPERRKEMDGSKEFVLNRPLLLFHADGIPERVKTIKSRAPASVPKPEPSK